MHTVHGSSAAPCHLPVWSTIDEVRRSDTWSFGGGGATTSKRGLDGNTHANSFTRAHGCPKGSCPEDSPCSRTSGRLRNRSGRSVGQLSHLAVGRTHLGSKASSRKSDRSRSPSLTSNKKQSSTSNTQQSSTSNTKQSPGIGFAVFRKCKELVGWVREAVWMDLTSSASSESLSSNTQPSRVEDPQTHSDYTMPTSCPDDMSMSDECSSAADSVSATTVSRPTSVNHRRRPSGASEEACRCASDEIRTSREGSRLSSRGRRANRECSSRSHRKRTSSSYCSDCTSCCGEDDDDSRCGDDCESDCDDPRNVQDVGSNLHRQRRNSSRSQSLRRDGKRGRWSGVANAISKIWDHIKDELLASSSSSGSESDDADCNRESPRLSSGSATRHFGRTRDVSVTSPESSTRPDPNSRRRPKSPSRGSNITLPQQEKFTRRHVRSSREFQECNTRTSSNTRDKHRHSERRGQTGTVRRSAPDPAHERSGPATTMTRTVDTRMGRSARHRTPDPEVAIPTLEVKRRGHSATQIRARVPVDYVLRARVVNGQLVDAHSSGQASRSCRDSLRDKSRDRKYEERWDTLTHVCADRDTCRTLIALPDVSDDVVIDSSGTIRQRSGKRLPNGNRQNDRTKLSRRPGNDVYVDRSDPEIRYSRDDQQLQESIQNSHRRSAVSVLNLVSRQESKTMVNERTQHLSRHSFELSTGSGHDDVTVVEVHSHGLHAYKKCASSGRGAVDRRIERTHNHDMFSQTLPETRSCFTSTSNGKDVQTDTSRADARPSAVNPQRNVGVIFGRDSDLPISDYNHENNHELVQSGEGTGSCYTSMTDNDRKKERAYSEFAEIGEGATEGDDRLHSDGDRTRTSVSTRIANSETQHHGERTHPSASIALNHCTDHQSVESRKWTASYRSMVRRFMSPDKVELAQTDLSPDSLPNASDTVSYGGGIVQIIHPPGRSQKPAQKERPVIQHSDVDQPERQIQQPQKKVQEQYQYTNIDQHEWLVQEMHDERASKQLPQHHQQNNMAQFCPHFQNEGEEARLHADSHNHSQLSKQPVQPQQMTQQQHQKPTQQQIQFNKHEQHHQKPVESSAADRANTSPTTAAATTSVAHILTTSISKDVDVPEQTGIDDSKMNVQRVIYEDIQKIMSASDYTKASDESAVKELDIGIGRANTDTDARPDVVFMSANSISRSRNGDEENNDIQSAPIIPRFSSSPLDSKLCEEGNRPNDPLSTAFVKVVDGFRETGGRIKLIRQRWDKTDEIVSKCESSRVDAKPERSVSFSCPDQPTVIVNRQDCRCEPSCGKLAPSNLTDVLATTSLNTTFPGECSKSQSVVKLVRPESITAASKQRLYHQHIQLANEQQLESAPVTAKELLRSPPLIDEKHLESVPVATNQPPRSMPIIRKHHPESTPDVNGQQLVLATVIDKQRPESEQPCNEHDLEAITTRVEQLCQLWEDINVTNSMDNKLTPPHWQKALHFASAGLQENAAVAKAEQSRGDSSDIVGDLTTLHQKWPGWTECHSRRLVRPADKGSSSDSTRCQHIHSRMAKSIANSLVRMHSTSTSSIRSLDGDGQTLEVIASIGAAQINSTDPIDASAGASTCRQLRLSPTKSEPSPDRYHRHLDQRTVVRTVPIQKNCSADNNSSDNTSSIGVRIPAKEESDYLPTTPPNSCSTDKKSGLRTSPIRCSQTNEELTSEMQKMLSCPVNQRSATISRDSLNASSVDSGNHSHDYGDSTKDEDMRQPTYRTLPNLPLPKVKTCRPLHSTRKGGTAKTLTVDIVRHAGLKLDTLVTKKKCSPKRNRLPDDVSQGTTMCVRGCSRAISASHPRSTHGKKQPAISPSRQHMCLHQTNGVEASTLSTQGIRRPTFIKRDQSAKRPSCADKHFPHQKTLLDGGKTSESETQYESSSTIRDYAQDMQKQKSQIDVGNINERQTIADSQYKSQVEIDGEKNLHGLDTFEITLSPHDNINGELYAKGSSLSDKGKRQSPVPFSTDSSSGEPVHRKSSWHKHRRKRSRARKSANAVHVNQSTTDTTTDDRSNDRMASADSQDMKYHSCKQHSQRLHKKRGKNNTNLSPVSSPKSGDGSTTVGESMEQYFDSNPWLTTTSTGKNISLNARKPPNTGYIFQSVYANETRLDCKHSQTDTGGRTFEREETNAVSGTMYVSNANHIGMDARHITTGIIGANPECVHVGDEPMSQKPSIARCRCSSPALHVHPLGQTPSDGELRLRRVQSHPPGVGRRSPTPGDKRSLKVIRKRVSALNGRSQLSSWVESDCSPREVEPNVLSSFAKVLDEIRNHPICRRYAECRDRTSNSVGTLISTDCVTSYTNTGSVRRNAMPHTTKKSTGNVESTASSDIVQDIKEHPLFKVAVATEATEHESIGGSFIKVPRLSREIPESTTMVATSTEQQDAPTDMMGDLRPHPMFREGRAIHKTGRSRAAANPRRSGSASAPARTRRPSDVATDQHQSSECESLEDAYDIAARILLDEIDGPMLNIREKPPTAATTVVNSERRLMRGDTTCRRPGVERAPPACGRGMQISRQNPTRRPPVLRKKASDGQHRGRTLSITQAPRPVAAQQGRCRALPTRRVVAPPLGTPQSGQPVVVDAADLHSSRRLKVFETTYIL